MNMDFGTFLAPPEDMTDKDDELEVDGIATNKIKSLPLKSESSKPQCFEEAPQKNVENFSTKSGPSANEETRSTGSVAGKVFTGYLTAGSNCFVLLIVFATNLLCQVFFSGSDVWLSYWTSGNVKPKETIRAVQGPPSVVASNISTFDTNEESLQVNLFNLGIYGGLVGGLCVVSIIRTISLFALCMRSSVALHDNMF